jgi:hypothetical protein
VEKARIWYERAKALGYKDADAKLKALSNSEAAIEATPASAAPKPVEVPVVPVVTTPQPVVEPAATPQPSETGAAIPEVANPEWVEVSSPVCARRRRCKGHYQRRRAREAHQATGRQGQLGGSPTLRRRKVAGFMPLRGGARVPNR